MTQNNNNNNKQDTFYLFRTQVSNIYKFGMSNRSWENRKAGYSGLNTPSKLITTYQIKSGSLEEHYFKMFLKSRDIPIIYGEEFFRFDGGIDVLLVDFMNMDKTQHPTFIEHSKELVKKTTLSNYHKDKHTDKYKCGVCAKRHGNRSALTSHYGSKKHKKKIVVKIVEDLVDNILSEVVSEMSSVEYPVSSDDESVYYDDDGDLVITDSISPYETDRMMVGNVMDYEADEETIYI